MAGSIERSLNELFSNITRADEDRYSAVIQDYFCFDSETDEGSDINGKCIHIEMNLIIISNEFLNTKWLCEHYNNNFNFLEEYYEDYDLEENNEELDDNNEGNLLW